jgi:predicted permease
MAWWHRVWRRKQLEEQLEKELLFHLDEHTAELTGRGRQPEEARRQARLALGGPEQVKEQCRDARGTRWLEDLFQDTRYALRALRKKPGFAFVTLCTLALGIGATTVMFTVVNGVLLKPLPYPDPERLLRLQEKTERPTQFGDLWPFAYPNYLDAKRESQALSMTAWRFSGGTLSEPGDPEYVNARQISSGLFSVLGVPLLQGRAFLPEEDRPSGAPVAIISQGLWQRRFGSNPATIGSTLVFDGKRFTITGVTPAGFRLFGDEADLFTPLGQDPAPNMQNRNAHPRIGVIARLRPGATAAQATAELALIGRDLARQFPESNAGRSFIADPLRPNVGDVGTTLWLLFGAVSLVLLIACVNVASLLLARALSRERELAMRVALGAGRGRLVRQCLTESAVLGLAGGALGVALAALGTRPFLIFWPGSLPRAEEVQLDWRVLVFAIAVSLVCGLLFGLAPAMRASVRRIRATVGSSRRVHGGFVVTEIALAVVLLVSAGMLGRALLRLSSLEPGVNIRNVLIARMALSPVTLGNPGRTRAAWQDVLDRAGHMPGVQAVAIVDTVPMREGNNQLGYSTTAAVPPRDELPIALATSVTPGYLNVMGIPLRRGRFFDDQDRMDNRPVVVIDEIFAQKAFGGNEAVGKYLWMPDMGPGPFEVVGVVGHVRHWGLASDDQAQIRAQFYYPFAQVPDQLVRRWSELMSIAVRTNAAPLNMIEPLRRELRGTTGDQVLYEVRTLDQLVSDTLARQRFLLLLFGIFAGLALLLACIGIYGVLAYVTSQRIPEIGLRMALGAKAGDVVRLVLRQSLGMIFAGVGVGFLAALAATRLLERSVDGVLSTGTSTFAVMIAVLVVAALCASFVPARRASQIDPMTALRQG